MLAATMVTPQSFTPAQAALVHDAVLAGLSFELADVPLRWLGQAETASVAVATPPEAVPAMAEPPVAAGLPQPAAVSAPSVTGRPWRVWHHGEAQGVVVVLMGETPPQGVAAVLLNNMLKAVGLHDLPVAYVGIDGTPPKGAATDAVREVVAPLAPLHTLLLGQQVLAALTGKSLGVEGWMVAPQSLPLPGRLGVTYGLEMLLQKPLFKGMAWRHLQAWQEQAHA